MSSISRRLISAGCGLLLLGASGQARGLTSATEADASVQAAPSDQGNAPSPEELELRRQRFREYFQTKIDALNRVATTKTSSGTIIDWVLPDPSEPRSEPPPTLPEYSAACGSVPGSACARTEVEEEAGSRGPPGTVPVVRFDVEAYLRDHPNPPADPGDALRKLAPPSPVSDGPGLPGGRYWVGWNHAGTYFGSGGIINVWNGGGPANVDETDIAQVAVFTMGDSNADGTPDFAQSVEAGKIEYPGLNGGSLAPFLFTFFTTNMWGKDGDNVCGYNQTVKGWHQVSSTKSPGMKLTSSVDGGTQQELFVQVMQNSVGDWWVWVNDEWIGYYPNSLFSSTKGIKDSAQFVNWYGEVHDSTMKATTTDMGSGKFASAWFTHAAYIRAMRYSWSRSNWWWFLDTSNALVATDSACYSGSGPFSDGTSSQFWQNYFFYGGPGLSTAAPSCK